ncbi:calcium-binding protein LPS1-alpha-like [Lytechinus variegatus]|uniref:calcium-binding protein LPS1-alpha-like n=1 Tax=Lytechinus variegatus TaxID=7654 RepID=UPI001BB1A886|nr:calcium-binding protein LPS1-alpha-like [Lytechinus variegatus]
MARRSTNPAAPHNQNIESSIATLERRVLYLPSITCISFYLYLTCLLVPCRPEPYATPYYTQRTREVSFVSSRQISVLSTTCGVDHKLEKMASGLPKEEIEELRKEFNKEDINKDGSISVDELSKVMGNFFTDDETRAWIKEVDINSDGRVQFEEYLLLVQGKKMTKSYNKVELERMFKDLDKDGSGKLCVQELRLGFKSFYEKRIDKILAECDKDGDGLIDYKEFTESLIFKLPVPE